MYVDQIFASLIIYANSENRQLFNCIESLKYQNSQNFEIIIIDNAWSESREEYINKANLNGPVQYINQPKSRRNNMEIANCRNLAIQESKGQILIFTNDLMVFPKDFIQKHSLYHQGISNLCVLGNIEYLSNQELDISKMEENFEFHLSVTRDKVLTAKYNYEVLQSERIVEDLFPWVRRYMAHNLSIQKELITKIGGFDEDLAIYAASDADFIYRIKQQGIQFIWAKEIISYQQDHVSYPTVRWRAGGCDYLPFKYQTDDLFDWLHLRQMERDVIDYNRYHETKVGISKDYEETIYTYYHHQLYGSNGDIRYSFILLIDQEDELERRIKQVIDHLNTICREPDKAELIIAHLNPTYHTEINIQLQKMQVSFSVRYYYWNDQEEWKHLVIQNKMMNMVLQKKTKQEYSLIEHMEKRSRKQFDKLNEESLFAILDKANGFYTKVLRLSELESRLAKDIYCKAPFEEKKVTVRPIHDYDIQYQQPYEMLKDGFSLPPRAVSFRLTHKCNLKCKMCGQWGTFGNFKEKDKGFVEAMLDINVLKKTVDQTAHFRPGMYYIWGGEPLLHPNYVELIRYIKAKNIYCTTTTNGTLLKKYAEEICEVGTEFIRVSIDGPERIHNRIRGQENCFQQSIVGIRQIHEIKSKYNLTYPIIECDCVILPENYQYIEEYLDQMSEVPGLHSVNFSHPIYALEEVGKRHLLEFREKFGIDATSWKGFVMDMNTLNTSELIEIIRRVQGKEYKFPINFDPPMKSLKDVHLHYRDIETLYKNRFCTVPWIWVEIHPNGLVSFCEDFCDFYVGNIYENSFLEIWNSIESRTYRKALLDKKKFPICSHCGLLCHDADY